MYLCESMRIGNDLTIRDFNKKNMDNVRLFKNTEDFLTAPFSTVFMESLASLKLTRQYTGKVRVLTDAVTASSR